MNCETTNLGEYRCGKCDRLFYVDATQPHPLDRVLPCPYGCDGDTARERDIVAETRVVGGRCVSDYRGIKCYYVVLSFSGEDFEDSMHRKPYNQREFDRWGFFMEKGMFEGNIDWDNIRKCARGVMQDEAMTHDATGKRAFDGRGRCLKCGSRVSFADATDTVVFAGNEIIKQYPGDITNRNCVRCTHPKQYPEYEDYDGGSSTRANRHQSGVVQR